MLGCMCVCMCACMYGRLYTLDYSIINYNYQILLIAIIIQYQIM